MTLHRCVGALIVRRKMILLGRRAPERQLYPGVWDIFGGHLEPGERRHQTLGRELREELGIDPRRWAYLQTLAAPLPGGSAIECHCYLVTDWAGAPRNLQPAEHSQIAWFSLAAAKRLDLAAAEYLPIFERCLG